MSDIQSFVDERPRLEAKAAAVQLEQLSSNVADSSSTPFYLVRSPSPLGCLDELPLSGHEEQIYLSFFNYRPVVGHYIQSQILVYGVPGSNELVSSGNALRLSVQSLAVAYYGRVHRQDRICTRARYIYSKALEELALELNHPGKPSHQRIMAAIVALTLYEMLTFHDANGWVQHAGGLGRLLQVLGPKSVQKGQGKLLFEFSRVLILWQSHTAREPCFLETEEWKTVPYVFDCETPSHYNNLFNLMTSLPRLTKECGALGHLLGTKEYWSKLETLRQEVSGFIPKLYHWRWCWEAELGDCVYSIFPSRNITQAFDDEGCPVFDSLIWYADLDRANDIVHYNTALMLFKHLCGILNLPDDQALPCPPGLTPKQPTTSGILLLPDQAPTTRDCALEICRSLNFHMLPAHAGPGALDVLAPARFAWLNLAAGSKEARWVEKVCQEIADNVGYELGRYMTMSRAFPLSR
ncbi:MAG: hypothetical protein M1822_001565 [Bathelium mastoideum]|nr:MAG: hypothetical protein M1822_001565 [Bathelium mastoideum]